MKERERIEILKEFPLLEKHYKSCLEFLGSHFETIDEYKGLLKERNEILYLIQQGKRNIK